MENNTDSFDPDRIAALEKLLRLMAGEQKDTDGRLVDLLGVDDPDAWDWVCMGSAMLLDTAQADPRAIAYCPRHPQRDNPSRVVLNRFAVDSREKEGGGPVSVVVYVGQCSDCGTIYWALEATAEGNL